VIYRLPIMMNREWEAHAEYIIKQKQNPEETIAAPELPTYNLVVPRSSCPACNYVIKAWQNIPVISYLILGGKCSNCGTKISIRYPTIELVTGLLSLIVVQYFSFGWELAAALMFTWFLIALSMIDIDHQLLPDSLTYLLLWLGLLFNVFETFTDLSSAVIGAMVGYLSLWSVFWIFKLITGKEGMGYGDSKLLAALGAWMGWQSITQVILVSSILGTIIGVGLILFKGKDKNQPIPFGPYLAFAGWIVLVFDFQLTLFV